MLNYMNIAIMQPYFFPYIGYYQMAFEVEKFVFLDDVSYIKRGYINRNKILLNSQAFDFSLPVLKASQNRNINEHSYSGDFSTFLKTVASAYMRAPHFDRIFSMLKEVLGQEDCVVSSVNARSISTVFSYLGLKKEFLFSSTVMPKDGARGQDRIISICKHLHATDYRNSIGGQELYDRVKFSDDGITLKFIESHCSPYPQRTGSYVPNLSMLDMLMWCDKDEVIERLAEYKLV